MAVDDLPLRDISRRATSARNSPGRDEPAHFANRAHSAESGEQDMDLPEAGGFPLRGSRDDLPGRSGE